MMAAAFDPDLQRWLEGYLRGQGAVAGSVHVREGEALLIRAASNLPAPVLEATAQIPKGKGMAGIAWQSGAPVTTCNLKDDDSGRVRPGARAVEAAAAAALPIIVEGRCLGVVGLAFAEDQPLPETALRRWTADATDALAGRLTKDLPRP